MPPAGVVPAVAAMEARSATATDFDGVNAENEEGQEEGTLPQVRKRVWYIWKRRNNVRG